MYLAKTILMIQFHTFMFILEVKLLLKKLIAALLIKNNLNIK